MIPANKSALFEAWFGRHVEGRIRGAFSSLRVAGAEHVQRASEAGPVLLLGNHTSWWDPLVAYHLSRSFFALDGHAMMDAKNLRKLPFFARIGAFGVDLDDPADGARSLRYAARLLDRPRRMVLVFPQGRERPVTERPLGFRPGAAELARIARRAETIPFALRYEMGAEERPRAYVSFGPAMPRERDAARLRVSQEAAVTGLLDGIDRALCGGDESGFSPLFVASTAAGELAAQALGWLAAPRPR